MEQQDSFCLDIRVGRNEQYREELIVFLCEKALAFGVTKAQRLMWNGTKILRVQTPKAAELAQFLIDKMLDGDEFEYVVHESRIDAQRADWWNPDYDTALGYEEFDLVDLVPGTNMTKEQYREDLRKCIQDDLPI